LILGLKALTQYARIHLDGKEGFVDNLAKDFVDFTNFSLILQIDARIEIGNFVCDRPTAHQLGFTIVLNVSGFDNLGRRTFVAETATATASSASSSSRRSSSASK
jgi:hypothetical protein